MCKLGLHDWKTTSATNYLKCSRCDAAKKVNPLNIWDNFEIEPSGKIVHRDTKLYPIIEPNEPDMIWDKSQGPMPYIPPPDEMMVEE